MQLLVAILEKIGVISIYKLVENYTYTALHTALIGL